jgi:tetratricopeptide (TPR) repeat protein
MLRSVLSGCCFILYLQSAGSPQANAFIGKGSELMQAERYEEAAAQFKRALEYDKTLDYARKNLAICEFEIREYTIARTVFEQLSAGKYHVVAIYYLGRLDLIEGNLDAAIGRLRSVDEKGGIVDATYFLGVAYFKKALYEEAIKALRHCLELNPRDFRAHQWLAKAFTKLGRAEEAHQEFEKTRDLHQYYTEGSTAIAECRTLLMQKKTLEAWASCKPLLDTDDVDKVTAIAMLFAKMGDQVHAMTAWERAVKLDPDSPEANYNLAFASFQRKDIGRAKHYAQIAFQLWPQFPEASILYGTILYMIADDLEAVKVLTRAHELRPDDANVSRLLADLQARSKPQ